MLVKFGNNWIQKIPRTANPRNEMGDRTRQRKNQLRPRRESNPRFDG